MKKLTISIITVLLFLVISILKCFSVCADEIVLDGEKTTDIEIDENWYWESDFSLSSNYDLLSNEESFMFYDQLDENNKAAYDVMKAWLKPRTDTLDILLPDPVSFQVDSLDMSSWSKEQSDEFGSIVVSCIKDGKTALVLDYPEIFWFDENNIKLSISYATSYNYRKKLYTIKVNKIYVTAPICDVYENTETAEDFINILKESIDNLNIEGSDYYTKVKYIHDYIVKAVMYNMDSPYRNTALGVFIDPYEVVCEGYSEAVKLLCDKENIPCISVIGNVNVSNKTAHMWNYIQMEDGKWYGLDCTWDDLDDDNEPVKYQHFLTGASNFLSSHIPDSMYITQNFTYPELNDTDYIYSSKEPVVTTTVSTDEKSTVFTTTSTSVSSFDSTTKVSSKLTTFTTITSAAISTNTSVTPIVKGDFNENGILDIGDAVMLQKKLLRLDAIRIKDYIFELNDDNTINIFDYIILRRMLIKI